MVSLCVPFVLPVTRVRRPCRGPRCVQWAVIHWVRLRSAHCARLVERVLLPHRVYPRYAHLGRIRRVGSRRAPCVPLAKLVPRPPLTRRQCVWRVRTRLADSRRALCVPPAKPAPRLRLMCPWFVWRAPFQQVVSHRVQFALLAKLAPPPLQYQQCVFQGLSHWVLPQHVPSALPVKPVLQPH